MKKNTIWLKSWKLWILACMICLLAHVPVLAVSDNTVEEAITGTVAPPTPEPSKPPAPTNTSSPKKVKNGWETLKNGKRRYYRNDKYVTGLVSINGKQYFFTAKGYLLKQGWGTVGKKRYRTDKRGMIIKNKRIKIKKKVYYLDAKGVMLKKGWKVFKAGKSYFGADGVRVSGLKKIGEKYYFFTKNGIMKKSCWKTFKAGKSYFGANGVRAEGVKKIGKKWYYFNSKGIMQTGTVNVKSTTYYLNDSGVMQARKVKSKYYHANGKAMSGLEAQDFETLERAKSIAAGITNSQMSQSQKLKACFDWVISKPYVTRRVFSNFAGWPAVYANDHFVLNGGNCHADAAAFAYLAKALGYKNIYVCVDSDGRGGSGHGWAEINGLVYDPLFAEAKSYSRNYGVPYGVYVLHPVLHIAV